MNGPDHYREAERLLTEAEDAPQGASVGLYFLGAAQVHATLALAAATAVCSPAMFRDAPPDQDLIAWQEVAGGAPEPEPSSEPGQVEPEPAGVRVDQMSVNALICHPELNGGQEVRITGISVSEHFDGHRRVMFEDPHMPGLVEVRHLSNGTLVTPVGGAE
ncbi:hypothetical protein ACIBCT_20795 [Streptosporangium sp. NPDC050855]|uniref:hypothetical protein n=1 Tax=Streptosporangium sp. NPDC050855 TaxID=3366194 RepID=UPI0037A60E85